MCRTITLHHYCGHIHTTRTLPCPQPCFIGQIQTCTGSNNNTRSALIPTLCIDCQQTESVARYFGVRQNRLATALGWEHLHVSKASVAEVSQVSGLVCDDVGIVYFPEAPDADIYTYQGLSKRVGQGFARPVPPPRQQQAGKRSLTQKREKVKAVVSESVVRHALLGPPPLLSNVLISPVAMRRGWYPTAFRGRPVRVPELKQPQLLRLPDLGAESLCALTPLPSAEDSRPFSLLPWGLTWRGLQASLSKIVAKINAQAGEPITYPEPATLRNARIADLNADLGLEITPLRSVFDSRTRPPPPQAWRNIDMQAGQRVFFPAPAKNTRVLGLCTQGGLTIDSQMRYMDEFREMEKTRRETVAQRLQIDVKEVRPVEGLGARETIANFRERLQMYDDIWDVGRCNIPQFDESGEAIMWMLGREGWTPE